MHFYFMDFTEGANSYIFIKLWGLLTFWIETEKFWTADPDFTMGLRIWKWQVFDIRKSLGYQEKGKE